MATIGEELRRERTRRGMSIKDAEQVLHIRTAYLEALEEDDYKIIPGDVYVKGFIRNYANFLELDGQKMVNAYKELIGEEIITRVRPMAKERKQNKLSASEEKIHRRLTYEGRKARRKKTMQKDRITISSLLFFVVLFLLWLFFF